MVISGTGWSRRPEDGRDHLVAPGPRNGPRDHVVILDGTLSSLEPGFETNVGLIFQTLCDVKANERASVFYEEGIQWDALRDGLDVMTGTGINRQIMRAYGFLASRYRAGDRIFLFGYSRGAFAVRSLAGIIDRIGLIRARSATQRMVQQLYRHYRNDPHGAHAQVFAKRFCHRDVSIEMVGVFDTVKALGWRLPLLWRLSESTHSFHSTHLGTRVRNGFHALALNETRPAYEPVLWSCPPGFEGNVQQVWFRGTHGDIGGQLGGFQPGRPLSNIPLVWMLEQAEALDLALPQNWRARFPCDATAPSAGGWRGWNKAFPLRRRRVVGQDPSESLHPTAVGAERKVAGTLPLLAGNDLWPVG